MAKKVIWTSEASAAYDSIIAYLETHWSQRTVEKFVAATAKVIEVISHNPFAFRQSTRPNVREAVILSKVLLAYKIYPNRIDLITFWDTRQNPKRRKF